MHSIVIAESKVCFAELFGFRLVKFKFAIYLLVLLQNLEKAEIIKSRISSVICFEMVLKVAKDEWRTLITRSEKKLSSTVTQASNLPCARTMARHGSAAVKVEADKASGLESIVVLCQGHLQHLARTRSADF